MQHASTVKTSVPLKLAWQQVPRGGGGVMTYFFFFHFLDDSADSCDRVLLFPDSFVRLTRPDPSRRLLSLYLAAY
jgi:hypothetical protein